MIMFDSLNHQSKLGEGVVPTAIGRMLQYAGAICGAAIVFGALYFLISLE
jgi:hypothetical protein